MSSEKQFTPEEAIAMLPEDPGVKFVVFMPFAGAGPCFECPKDKLVEMLNQALSIHEVSKSAELFGAGGYKLRVVPKLTTGKRGDDRFVTWDKNLEITHVLRITK